MVAIWHGVKRDTRLLHDGFATRQGRIYVLGTGGGSQQLTEVGAAGKVLPRAVGTPCYGV